MKTFPSSSIRCSIFLCLVLTGSLHLKAAPPNLIIIMADDMGYGDASCLWDQAPQPTPNLDRMAREGLLFTDFHSSGNVCSPTRAGFMTGRYQQRAGIPGVINADPRVPAHFASLQHEEVTFAELLKEAGYSTAMFGKWHLSYDKKYNPVTHGFDRFRGYISGNIDFISHYDRMEVYDWWEGQELIEEEGYVTHLITQHSVKYIHDHKNKPFCLYVAHEAVHSPWQGPGDPPQRGPNKVRGRVDKNRAWKEMMRELDQGVGEILQAVEKAGIADNTLVFFFSDNGPAGGSAGPLRGRKGSNWEGGHRVPAIAHWPGKIKPDTRTDQLAISLDLMPTMLALAGKESPVKLDGVNLSPVLFEQKSLGDRQLHWNGKAMRDGNWKLMINGKGAKGLGLYNLKDDIGEQKNLAEKFPQRVEKMKAAIEAWTKEVNEDAREQPTS